MFPFQYPFPFPFQFIFAPVFFIYAPWPCSGSVHPVIKTVEEV